MPPRQAIVGAIADQGVERVVDLGLEAVVAGAQDHMDIAAEAAFGEWGADVGEGLAFLALQENQCLLRRHQGERALVLAEQLEQFLVAAGGQRRRLGILAEPGELAGAGDGAGGFPLQQRARRRAAEFAVADQARRRAPDDAAETDQFFAFRRAQGVGDAEVVAAAADGGNHFRETQHLDLALTLQALAQRVHQIDVEPLQGTLVVTIGEGWRGIGDCHLQHFLGRGAGTGSHRQQRCCHPHNPSRHDLTPER
ncbi:hypothetical protein SDC9_125021 [bioreactor metagenome]|uniref:Uncharacterized protein n=1 Tax=bioreactor metagenome TaxID=1076179 RepID=A0A645CM31_9ZZZZ